MKGSRYIRVLIKLYLRSLKRTPHTAAISLMTIITLGLTSFVAFDAWINHGRFAESTFTQWNNFQRKISGRNIANVEISQCDNNNVNFQNLLQEIKLIEGQFETGHFIEGSWYGVNLKTLPAIQAQFLANFGQYLGDQNQSQNFSHCTDVPCIISSFYQGDHEAGLLAYYWYLKTGSMISMSNKIPGQKSQYPGDYQNRKHLLKDYLFSKDDLKKFFILAKSLPEKFLHNPLFKSIHKLPNNSRVENYSQAKCAVSSAQGHILINQDCLGFSNDLNTFLINVTSQMAHYIDLYEGRKHEVASLSSSTEWKDRSLWIKDEFFDSEVKQYSSKWFSHLPSNQFVSVDAKENPETQLAQLIAYYRFKPTQFTNSTPPDIQDFIKNEIFNGEQYDGNGLYKQYVTSAVNQWSKSEVSLWSDCFEQYLKPEAIENSARDLASQVDNPLYSCVEHKIPRFVQDVVQQIQNENYEGCRFFNDEQKYGHLSDQFHHVLNKFLQERILKRKIEFQNHGREVLVGQTIKHDFIQKVDPSSVFINCFYEENQKECYEEKMLSEVNKLLNKNHKEISSYYRKIIRDDVLQLFPYHVIAKKTNEIAKNYIAPFYTKIHFTAKYLWDSCKDEKFSAESEIKLPLKFSGGKHFVNAKLLNCINTKMDDELYQVVNLGAFHEIDEKVVEFKLSSQEKKFALSFMEGKLVQILNNILEDEVRLEKSKLDQHFNVANGLIAKNLIEDKSFFNKVYSFTQVTNECLERVHKYYPQKFFYKSTAQIDNKYGRKICSSVIETPEIKVGLTKKVEQQWQENQKLAFNFLDTHFAEYVADCAADYPAEKGRARIRNARMRKICIEESFEIAVNDALLDWQDDEHYEYFKHKEQDLTSHLMSYRNQMFQTYIK